MSRIDTKVRRLIELKDAATRTNQQADAAMKAFRQYERDLWEELAEEHGDIKTLTFEDLPPYGRVQIQRRSTVYADVYDMEEAAAGLKAMGLEEAALKPAPRMRVLHELVRDWLEAGTAPPRGIGHRETKYISVSRR